MQMFGCIGLRSKALQGVSGSAEVGFLCLCAEGLKNAPLAETQNRSACAHEVRSSAAEGPSRRDSSRKAT